jgi:cystathionine beta-lyase
VILSDKVDARQWRSLPLFATPGPTPLGVAASTAAYREGNEWRNELVQYLAANHAHVQQRLRSEAPELIPTRAEATFLTWIDGKALGVDDPARFFLEEAKVALGDGPPFGIGYDHHVRLNVGTSRAILDQILTAMVAATQRQR